MQKTSQEQLRVQIEQCLTDTLHALGANDTLSEAMRYASLNGGKRLRPLLTIAGGALGAAGITVLLKVGVAVELIHCYSLVHDDLPAMDNDDLRRGLPTCHKKYNEAIAILAGDALQTMAFELLSSRDLHLTHVAKLQIINLLSNASGVRGMAGGQALDLLATGHKLDLKQLKLMHHMKTGALIRAAILAGYLCGDYIEQPVYEGLESIANNLGLLFQVIDDILDVTADTVTLGKTANKDLINEKATFVSVLGLDGATVFAQTLYLETRDLLSQFEHSEMLIELTDSIYLRKK